MARNGSGTMSVVNTAVAGTPITSTAWNQNFTDIAAEITNSVALDGQSTLTGQLKLSSGTVAAPGWAFGSDTDTGAYRIGSNNIGISCGGVLALDISAATLAAAGVVATGNGTVSAPAWSFSADLDCGAYRIGANNIGVAVNGAKVLDIGTTGLGVTGTAVITSSASGAITVGPNGATNPAFQVDASTASAATGLKVTGAAAAGGVAVAAVSSGTNENLTIDAKGSGTVTINGTGTGDVAISRPLSVAGALTVSTGSVTVSNGNVKALNTPIAAGCITYSGGTPTLESGSVNTTSVTDTAVGRVRVNLAVTMSSSTYVVISTAAATAAGSLKVVTVRSKTTTTFEIDVVDSGGNLTDDVASLDFIVIGATA